MESVVFGDGTKIYMSWFVDKMAVADLSVDEMISCHFGAFVLLVLRLASSKVS